MVSGSTHPARPPNKNLIPFGRGCDGATFTTGGGESTLASGAATSAGTATELVTVAFVVGGFASDMISATENVYLTIYSTVSLANNVASSSFINVCKL